MYHDFFNLDKDPFSIAPDPSFLYLSEGHREALAHLMYGFEHGGFVLITGEVGTGKTTLLRNLTKQTPPHLDVAFILNPRLTVSELLETICEELGIPFDKSEFQSVKQYIDLLNRHLLRSYQNGRSTVVIIDEAQNLSPAVLEQIRLLTNLETNERKLMRIILLGQPELGEMLDRTELRQLAQRITARYHLASLNRDDCYAYVAHRLAHAGGNPDLFSDAALRKLYRLSGGTPRLINILADRSLLGAYAQGRNRIGPAIVANAAKEVFGKQTLYKWWMAAGIVGIVAAVMTWAWVALPTTEQVEIVTPTPAATPPLLAAPPVPESPSDHQRSEPVSVPTPVAATEPDVEVFRQDVSSYTSQRHAYAAVFEHWGHDYAVDSVQVPCDFAPTVGLQCLGQSGGWSDIERLNLPVVLELRDEGDLPFYGAVTSARAGRYGLRVGNTRYEVSPEHLRDVWFGRYVVLWQMPPGYRGSLREGDEHSSVGWLRAQLGNVVAMEPTAESNRFDAALHDAVTTFQEQEGLLTDGIVGPATWIRLADRLQLDAPKLDS